jgi:hypothetical protein
MVWFPRIFVTSALKSQAAGLKKSVVKVGWPNPEMPLMLILGNSQFCIAATAL